MKKVVGIILNNSKKNELDIKNIENKGDPHTAIASKYRLIDFPLSNMANSGIRNVAVMLGNYSQKLTEHIGSGKDYGLERNINGLLYLEEDYLTLQGLGTPNDLRDLLKNIDYLTNIKEEYILVSGSNFVANIDYKKIFNEECLEDCDMLLLYKKNDQKLRFVNQVVLNAKGVFEDIYYVTEETVVENLFMDTFFIKKEVLIQMLRAANRSGILCMNAFLRKVKREITIKAYEYTEFAYYIDSPKSYYEANMAFLDQKIWQQIFNVSRRLIYTKNSDLPPTAYGPRAVVENSLLTSGDEIYGQVKNSVIFRNVKILDNSTIENCIIGDNSIIEENVHLKNIIIEPNCRISSNTTLISSPENPMVIN